MSILQFIVIQVAIQEIAASGTWDKQNQEELTFNPNLPEENLVHAVDRLKGLSHYSSSPLSAIL